MKSKCKFCYFDENIFNTKLFESKYFFAIPTIGALIPNYILVVSKRHINAMSELNEYEFNDYLSFVNYLSNVFYKKFNNKPILFEHGCPDTKNNGANSILHAHTHLLNFNFKNNNKLLKELKFIKFDISKLNEIKTNYIYYKDNAGLDYISYDFENTSQLMRIKIAEDLGIKSLYNWKEQPFIENVFETINNLK